MLDKLGRIRIPVWVRTDPRMASERRGLDRRAGADRRSPSGALTAASERRVGDRRTGARRALPDRRMVLELTALL